MTHKFCIDCSAKNFFESSPPEFCCKCGQPFNRGKKNVVAKKSVARVSRVVEEEYEEEEEELFDLDALAEDWEGVVDEVKYETIGEAVFVNGSPKRGPRQARPSKFGKKDIVKQTMNECKSHQESKSGKWGD